MTSMDTETATDPVCGMTVKIAGAKNTTHHAGHTFCSPRCRAKFTADPEHYLKPADAPAAKPVATGATYTCPMHPEVRQPGPGNCPICGMALEPEEVSLDQGRNEELAEMTRRLWIGGGLAVPVVLFGLGGHFLPLPHGVSEWVQLVFATPVVLWAGWPFFVR